MRFVCDSCGTALIVQGSDVGVSGPCPNCTAWIDASSFESSASGTNTLSANIPRQKRQANTRPSSKGRISADGYLDHDYNDRREVYGTLKVLSVTLAVMAMILFVIVFMNQWMEK